jgi:hypothetical protein
MTERKAAANASDTAQASHDTSQQENSDPARAEGRAFLEDLGRWLRRREEGERTWLGEDVRTPIDVSGKPPDGQIVELLHRLVKRCEDWLASERAQVDAGTSACVIPLREVTFELFSRVHTLLLSTRRDGLAKDFKGKYETMVSVAGHDDLPAESGMRWSTFISTGLEVSPFCSSCRRVATAIEADLETGKRRNGQEQTGETPMDHIQLENGAYKVLHTLGSSPTRLHQEDLALCEDPPMDRKTVRRHLTTLAKAGLVDYNSRDKKGATITPKGRDYLDSQPK